MKFRLTTIISADRPLCDALRLMDDEGTSSVAVVDNQFNVVGNISSTDVKVCLDVDFTARMYKDTRSDYSSF